jgi:hypothetical protein
MTEDDGNNDNDYNEDGGDGAEIQIGDTDWRHAYMQSSLI